MNVAIVVRRALWEKEASLAVDCLSIPKFVDYTKKLDIPWNQFDIAFLMETLGAPGETQLTGRNQMMAWLIEFRDSFFPLVGSPDTSRIHLSVLPPVPDNVEDLLIPLHFGLWHRRNPVFDVKGYSPVRFIRDRHSRRPSKVQL